MPLLATGVLTLVLLFYSGYAFRGQQCTTVSEMIASSFLYSMLIAWVIFLLAYFLDLGSLSLGLLIVAVTAVGFWRGQYRKLDISSPYNKKKWPLNILLVLLAGVLLYFTYLYIQKFYTPVFTFWDALASYNHWAIELSEGKYQVGGAAYPILYPGLWSLLYRLQDDPSFWIISKASLIAAPIALFIYSFALSLERRSLFPTIFITSCAGLIIFRTPYFLSGMMDIAVVMLGMLSCLLLWKESTEEKTGNLSLLAAGIASLVKQAGLAFLLLAILVKLTTNKPKTFLALNWKAVLTATMLPLSFLAFFLYYNDILQILNSFRGLQKVAENAANTSELIPQAFSLVYNFLPMKITLPLGAILITGIYLSTPQLRWLSVYSLIIAAVGFLIWMLFSSYDVRNVYWSIMLLIFAASIGLDALIGRISQFIFRNKPTINPADKDHKIQIYGLKWLKPLIITLPLFSLLPIALLGEDRLQMANIISRNESIPTTLRPMFEHPPPGMPRNFIVLTNVQTLVWVPKLQGRIEIDLFRGKYQRIRKKLENSKASVLLLKHLPDGGDYENVQKLKEDELIKQVVDSELYSIYIIQR